MSATARKFVFPEALWAGTDHSLDIAMDVHDHMMAGMFGSPQAVVAEEEAPYTFSQQGEVGIVSIRGSLVNRDSPYNRYCNITSYAEIRRSVIHAATDPTVKAILLDIDSGGGAVAGCADCGELISMIHKSVKPVYAFSGGTMASAAMWIGLSAGKVFVSNSTISGSIGVICTHIEYSKMYKEAGIGVKVLRAGEYKALANSNEPLSTAAEKQLQDQLNSAYALFITFAAAQRGVSVTEADATFGQGREFFGQAAVAAGLVDGVTNFDGMVSKINKKIDTSAKRDNTTLTYPQGASMTRQALTEQQIAAMAAGGVMPDAAAVAAAAIAAAAVVPPVAAEVVAPVVAAVVPEAVVAAVVAPAADAGVVALLQGQLKDKDTQLLSQAIELTGLKAENAGMKATHDSLVKIAAASVSTMKVALGGAKADFAAMTPALLVAEHSATETAFKAAFKVGGVAATSAEVKPEATKVDHQMADRVLANRYPTAR